MRINMYKGIERDLAMFFTFVIGVTLSTGMLIVFAILLAVEFYEFVSTYDQNMDALRKLASEA